jgi:NifU-like domain
VSDNPELDHPLAQIGSLVEGLERLADADARERARALVQAVLDIHRLGLARVLALAAARDGGPALVDELARDQTIAILLSLHGLHPRDVDTRVRLAIDEARAGLLELGVAVELSRISDDTAHVRVKAAGAAGAVRASPARIRTLVEGAIGRAAPEIAAVEIDGLDQSALVSITRLPQRPR